MKHTLKLPRLGETTDFVVVESWEVEVEDVLGPQDVLMTVETDKVTAEVPTPVAGRLVQKLVAEGDEVPVGAPIAVVEAS